jgi:hypothetical protein
MNKSENINELAKALARVQAKMKPAEFDSVNPYYKSKYASLGSVIQAYKEAAKGEGISISQLPISDGWYVGVENVIMHESGQWISERFLMPLDADSKNPTQEAGKAITYARRYGLASMFGIYSDEDTDGNSPSQEVKKTVKPAIPDGRPYKPDVLKEKLQVMLEHVNPASDKQRKFLAILLGQEFSDNDIRHDAQEYLFGARSLNDVDGKMVNAALKWLSPEPDSGGAYVVSELAKKELSGVQSAFLMSKGQQKMDDLLSGISK